MNNISFRSLVICDRRYSFTIIPTNNIGKARVNEDDIEILGPDGK